MNLGDIFRLVLVKGILSAQNSSYSTISETSGITRTPLFTYSPYKTESRLLSSLFPPWSDYTSGKPYWSTADYTSRRPYWYTSRSPYRYTTDYRSRRPYTSSPDYTTRRSYWSTTFRPLCTTGWTRYPRTFPFTYTLNWSTPNVGTSYSPYISTTSRNTRGSEASTAETETTTALPITTTAKPSTAQPRSSTTEIPPKPIEYKGINNFFAEKIIFIGNNIYTYNKPEIQMRD